jgi:hypothetical protein
MICHDRYSPVPQSRWKQALKGSFIQGLMGLIRHKQIDIHIIATEK